MFEWLARLPSLTQKISTTSIIIEQNLDWVDLSFVEKRSDITELKNRIREKKADKSNLPKIEMPDALKNIRDII